MMKVSDPIMFGHRRVACSSRTSSPSTPTRCKQLGVDAEQRHRRPVRQARQAAAATSRPRSRPTSRPLYAERPALAMVNSDKGITNLHVPSDIIVDASMPAMIRDSGKMWNRDGKLQDTKAMIPDRCYAGIYQAVIEDCKKHGAFDPATMGSVPNVGLMAQKAEEYGSHDKTFQIAGRRHRARGRRQRARCCSSTRSRRATSGACARPRTRRSRTGSSWPSPAPRLSDTPAVFWLDKSRAHDAQMIAKVETLPEGPRHHRPGHPHPAAGRGHAQFSLERIRAGQGHHLGHRQRAARLPDRPVPDHGAGHQRQDAVDRAADGRRRPVRDRRRRLGAQARAAVRRGGLPALGFAGRVPGPGRLAGAPRRSDYDNAKAQVLAEALDEANGKFLDNNKSPARKVGELDNRGSHFYLAMYWAQALAAQTEDAELKARFATAGQGAGRQRGEDRRRAERGAGQAGGHRRLLPPGPRQGQRAPCARARPSTPRWPPFPGVELSHQRYWLR